MQEFLKSNTEPRCFYPWTSGKIVFSRFAVQKFFCFDIARNPPPVSLPPTHKKKLWFVPNANQPRNIERRINPSPPAVCKRFCFIQIQNPRYSCTLKSVNRLDQESWRGSRLETKAKQQIYFRARLIH